MFIRQKKNERGEEKEMKSWQKSIGWEKEAEWEEDKKGIDKGVN